jgi:hypothetical protein
LKAKLENKESGFQYINILKLIWRLESGTCWMKLGKRFRRLGKNLKDIELKGIT